MFSRDRLSSLATTCRRSGEFLSCPIFIAAVVIAFVAVVVAAAVAVVVVLAASSGEMHSPCVFFFNIFLVKNGLLHSSHINGSPFVRADMNLKLVLIYCFELIIRHSYVRLHDWSMDVRKKV